MLLAVCFRIACERACLVLNKGQKHLRFCPHLSHNINSTINNIW